jgi:hypothetical protein
MQDTETEGEGHWPLPSPELDARLQKIGTDMLNDFGHNHTIRVCVSLLAYILRHAPDEQDRHQVFGHIIEYIVGEVENPSEGNDS